MDFQIYLENSNLEILNTADLPSGKKFKSRFIQAGLAGYPQQYGNVLIKKESLDKFVNTLETKPVIINHQEVTANNVNEIEVGRVHNVWFNEEDGWYWCDGVITNQKAIDLIDKGWSVSCSYNVSNYSDKGGTENNIKYDMEFLDGNFTHLAIVKNPRYEGADIVVVNSNLELDNAKNFGGEEGRWITINGVHVFIPDGKQVEDVMREKGWLTDGKKEDKKEDKKEVEENPLNKWAMKFETEKLDRAKKREEMAGKLKREAQRKNYDDFYNEYRDLFDTETDIKRFHGETQQEYKAEQFRKILGKQSEGGEGKKNIKETKDEHGRTVFSKEGTNKKVKIHKNGNYYLASYGQELKDDDGYTEFQVFPSASGKSFKTEAGAKKWAMKQLTSDNSLTNTIAETLVEVIAENCIK